MSGANSWTAVQVPRLQWRTVEEVDRSATCESWPFWTTVRMISCSEDVVRGPQCRVATPGRLQIQDTIILEATRNEMRSPFASSWNVHYSLGELALCNITIAPEYSERECYSRT